MYIDGGNERKRDRERTKNFLDFPFVKPSGKEFFTFVRIYIGPAKDIKNRCQSLIWQIARPKPDTAADFVDCVRAKKKKSKDKESHRSRFARRKGDQFAADPIIDSSATGNPISLNVRLSVANADSTTL
mgnify:CR=1 FL=1